MLRDVVVMLYERREEVVDVLEGIWGNVILVLYKGYLIQKYLDLLICQCVANGPKATVN